MNFINIFIHTLFPPFQEKRIVVSSTILMAILISFMLVPAGRAHAAVLFDIENPPDSFSTIADIYYKTMTAPANIPHGTTVYASFCVTVGGGPTTPPVGIIPVIYDSTFSYEFNGVATGLDGSGRICATDVAMTSASLSITSGDTVKVGVEGNGTMAASLSSGDFVIISDTPTPPADTSTHIISVTPPNDHLPWDNARATSTTFAFGATGYVADDDYKSGQVVEMDIRNNAQNSSIIGVSLFNNQAYQSGRVNLVYKFPVTSSGAFSFSTSTNIQQIGVYSVQTKISKPVSVFGITVPAIPAIGFYGLSDSLAATSTQFLVATTTVFDALAGNSTGTFLDSVNQADAANQCTDWSDVTQLSSCVNSLFIPTDAQTNAVFDAARNGFLTNAPFGYLTLFVSDLASTTPVEPPALSYTFGSSSPSILQGGHYSINIFDHFDVLNSIKADDGSNKNVWDIVDPFFALLVAVSVLFVMLEDMIGVVGGGLGSAANFKEGFHSASLTSKEKKKIESSFVNGPKEDPAARRRLINARGRAHDARGGRGIIH